MTATLDTPVTAAPGPPPRPAGSRALVWTGGIVGGLLLLGGAWNILGQVLVANTDVEDTTVTASYGAAPVVELVADGDVTVTTGGREVVVERASRSAITTPTYSVEEGGDRLVVKHRCTVWFPAVCSASLTVQVPAGTDVVIRTGDGDASVRDLEGSVEVTARDGSTSVDDVVGDVSVRSGDGRVVVSAVDGSVDVESSDGSVEVTDVTGSVSARSSDGAVEISEALADIDASANDGSVVVYGTGEPVALDISVSDGRQTVEGPTDPSADVHVEIRTRDGDASYLGPKG